MTVTPEDIQRIAHLAALDVEPGALPALTEQIGRILDYVAQLSSVETGDHAPFRPPSHHEPQAMRADEVRPPDPPIVLSTFAPNVRDGLVVVPRVGGQDDEESA